MSTNGLDFSSNRFIPNLYPDKLNPGSGNFNPSYNIDAYFNYNKNNNYNSDKSLYSDPLNPGYSNLDPSYTLDKFFDTHTNSENLNGQYPNVDTSAVDKALDSKEESPGGNSVNDTGKDTKDTKATKDTKDTNTEKSKKGSVVVTKWGTTDKEGKRQDCLWNIAKNNYSLANNKDIMKKVDEILVYHNANAKKKGLRTITNADLIYTGETILLP